MNLGEALFWSIKLLKAKHIDSPALDVEIFLAFILAKPREYALTHPEKKLNLKQVSKFKKLIYRRARNEPVAYIIGKKEFFGLDFYVNKNVLIPRPETEILVEAALQELTTTNKNCIVVDVGTGSGCVAITMAREHKSTKAQEHLNTKTNKPVKIFALDSSDKALKIAKKNAKLHGLSNQIKFLRSNLLQTLFLQFQRSLELENLIIVANLPYLTVAEWKRTQPEIKKYEPREALIGGKDGLKFYRELLSQVKRFIPYLYPPPMHRGRKEGVRSITYFFEINPKQKNPLARLVKKFFPESKIEFIKDLNKSVRVLKINIQL